MNKTIINALKILDDIIGPYLLRIRVIRYKHSNSLKHILVIRPGGIGDAALLMPSIKKLKKSLPGVKVDVLCEPRNMGVFKNAPYIKAIYSYWSIRDMARIMGKEYDLVIDTEQSHLLSRFFTNSIIKAGKRVGFSANCVKSHYDISIPYFQEEYEAYSFNRLFSEAIPDWKKEFLWDPPYIYTSTKEKKKLEEIVLSFIKRPIVCIFAGASIHLRKWPALRWARVLEELWGMGLYPVLLGSRDEQVINRSISYLSKAPVADLTEMLSLSETAELFRKSRLLVSTDSGILHIAVIEGLNTVSLFGPGIAEKWGPKGNAHVVIHKDLSCSPCTRFGYTPSCKNNGICMKLISVEDVMCGVENIIKIREHENGGKRV